MEMRVCVEGGSQPRRKLPEHSALSPEGPFAAAWAPPSHPSGKLPVLAPAQLELLGWIICLPVGPGCGLRLPPPAPRAGAVSLLPPLIMVGSLSWNLSKEATEQDSIGVEGKKETDPSLAEAVLTQGCQTDWVPDAAWSCDSGARAAGQALRGVVGRPRAV